MNAGSAGGAVSVPVRPGERIASLDVLRGFAVLGILVVNIQSFAMASPAYFDPLMPGSLAGDHLWIRTLIMVFADTKFISIFSVLFGAGMALAWDRRRDRGLKGGGPFHFRRQGWLLAIGLAHGLLAWYGDILAPYAVFGMALWFLRKRSPRQAAAIGFGLALAAVGLQVAIGLLVQIDAPEIVEMLALEEARQAKLVPVEIAAFRGSWLDQLPVRAAVTADVALTILLLGWSVPGCMLIGMALQRWKVLSGGRSVRLYRRMIGVGLLAGMPVTAFAALGLEAGDEIAHGIHLAGSLGMAGAYIGLVVLAVKQGWFPKAQARLGAAGRMALSNYIAQSLICTLIFYGHGLGAFERVARPSQMAIVLAVCALQLLWSPWWLRRFRFGPLEWLWRSLAYRRRQPMRLRPGRAA